MELEGARSIIELQWGRASGARNSARLPTDLGPDQRASMGPCFGSTEFRRWSWKAHAPSSSFNGAVLREHGIRRGYQLTWDRINGLQWGRASGARNSRGLRRAATARTASMGPCFGSTEFPA